MLLEDHAGDIVRKAREAAGISREDAAKLAGVSTADLEKFEKTGAPQISFATLAPKISLNASKLEKIAAGWTPAPVDLSLWRELRTISTTEGGNTVNCFLVWDEVTREAALFDTGWDAEPILAHIRENQLDLKHLFLTHTHTDHIAAMQPIREAFPKVRLHSGAKSAPVDQRNRANDFIHLGSIRITNRETPGHAEDGVTYNIGGFPEDAPGVAIVGDCIFAGSMGTGFQSTDLLRESVKTKILVLPPDTLLCPGHGPLTTVREEIAHNPFF
jgi:hydroxyacylglutathione hydrolase